MIGNSRFTTVLSLGISLIAPAQTDGNISRTITMESVGACQGISHQQGKYFLYREGEGFTLTDNSSKGIAVSSFGKNNVSFLNF